jgi:hypothetical protein
MEPAVFILRGAGALVMALAGAALARLLFG